jgi:pimeloyl-ACP methyl ester carboxylesterase
MRLAYRDAGRGSPVLLLHGLFGSARNLGGVARALAAGHRVVSLDLRNHGESPHVPGMDYATMAADVADTMDALELTESALLGHSMGGKVAMRFALSWPDRVSRLVVADIAPARYDSHFGGFARAMLALPAGLSRSAADAALAPDVPDPAIRSFLLHNYRPAEGWRIGLPEIAASLPRIEHWDDQAASYAGPTLFVTGAQSDYVLQEHRPAILRLFPAARFVAIKDAGHWLHAQQPDAFNTTVSAFLAPLNAA